MSTVVTLGECLASFVAVERGPMAEVASWARTVAGSEANVAVGLARLGVDVAFIGRVGADGLGEAVRRRLRGEGVDVAHLGMDTGAATGVMFRELRDLGPAEVVYWRRGSAGSRLSSEDVAAAADRFEGVRWLHVSGVTPALSSSAAGAVDAAIALARSVGASVSLDLNMRRRLWTDQEAAAVLAGIASRCEVVLGTLDEVALVAGIDDAVSPDGVDPEVAADAMLALGPRSVVVKLGTAGALARITPQPAGTTSTFRAAALAGVPLIDPVGAGDAFTSGFIAATLEGLAPVDVLRTANACGASVVATFGDVAGLPNRVELERLLAASSGSEDTLR